MKATELRIGNWYLWEAEGKKYPYQIEARDLDSNYIQNFDPVPLTEEWLVKFGFEMHRGGVSYDKNKLSIYLGDTILSGPNGRTYFNSWAILEYSPKYVHQLQNLYFALTGEELTPKE